MMLESKHANLIYESIEHVLTLIREIRSGENSKKGEIHYV